MGSADCRAKLLIRRAREVLAGSPTNLGAAAAETAIELHRRDRKRTRERGGDNGGRDHSRINLLRMARLRDIQSNENDRRARDHPRR